MKWKDSILCSGKVNRYGYTLLVSGLRLASFLANPIMLYVHRRSLLNAETDELSLPIGKWDNIRIEDGKLLATPDFDMDDEFAVKIARKWEHMFGRRAGLGNGVVRLDRQHIVGAETHGLRCIEPEA